jgi:anti-anti-sigma factor
LELTERRTDNAVVVVVDGRVDMHTANDFEKRLIPIVKSAGEARTSVVIDFSNVDYMSSAGLRVIMIASKTAKATQTPIAIAGLQPTVREVYAIARFDAVVPCHNDVDAALAAVAPKT